MREKTVHAFILIILFLFGIYLSILYYGYHEVPNPDFTSFFETGRQLLSLHLPDSYKRAPILGILQVLLSSIIDSRYPDLTAGWVLNSCLLPLNLILFWLVGRKIIGRTALWISLISIINPWTVEMAMQPIAETLLLFCILLTFYAIFNRSRWAYLFASVTTMVRYEGALLILIVFALDMLEQKKEDNWSKPFLYAVLSSVPFGLWILVTLLNWQTQGNTYYLKEMGATSEGKILWFEYIKLIWQMGVRHLFETNVFASEILSHMASRFIKVMTLLSFIFGVGYGLFKRNWKILALIIFLVGYLFIHAVHAVLLYRYCVPVYWIVLLICAYGIINGWEWINRVKIITEKAIWVLQVLSLILITVWLFLLVLHIPKIAFISPQSISVPYVFACTATFMFFAQTLQYGNKLLLKNITITLLIILIGFSNQFQLVKTVNDGKEDLEFKLLSEWYTENAKSGETMLSTMSNVIKIFAPGSKDVFKHISTIPAKDPDAFIEACYSKGIDYVVWDSRLCSKPDSRYGTLWKVENIETLKKPHNSGPFIFVKQIQVGKNRVVNIFQLKKRA